MDIDRLEDRPWMMPGADKTDYFNYGFDENSWINYSMRQQALRKDKLLTQSITVFPAPPLLPCRTADFTRLSWIFLCPFFRSFKPRCLGTSLPNCAGTHQWPDQVATCRSCTPSRPRATSQASPSTLLPPARLSLSPEEMTGREAIPWTSSRCPRLVLQWVGNQREGMFSPYFSFSRAQNPNSAPPFLVP